ncbi:MAG: hypothetical protein V2A79_19290 [Planctomycetota bacterium]
MAGFTFRYRLSGGAPTILDLLSTDTLTVYKGDFMNLETGELDIAATNDAALVGAILEGGAVTDSTTRLNVIVDADAVYAVTDANARLVGAALDITSTPGSMGVTSVTNTDFIVVAESSASEETLVMIAPNESWMT